MGEQALREAIRQELLTVALGQVTCPANRLNDQMHDFWITKGYSCPGCGAAL